MKKINLIFLFLFLTLFSCGKNSDDEVSYDRNGPRDQYFELYAGKGRIYPYIRMPLTFYVNTNKYYTYMAQFNEVSNNLRSSSGKQLIIFEPRNDDPKYVDMWDSKELGQDGEFWIMFRENDQEFVGMKDSTAASALSWSDADILDNQIKLYSHVIFNFTIDQWSQDNFKQVLYHEILHVLGFGHTYDSDYSVMNYNYVYEFDGISDLDYDRLEAKYDFTQNISYVKDLEKIAAKIEDIERHGYASILELQFGLSAERSSAIAKVIIDYNKIGSKRSLTNKDRDIVAKKLLGSNYQEAKRALEKHIAGDGTDLEEIIEKASFLNGITPEHLSELVSDLLL